MLRVGKYAAAVASTEAFNNDPDDVSETDVEHTEVENTADSVDGTTTTADSAGTPEVTADAPVEPETTTEETPPAEDSGEAPPAEGVETEPAVDSEPLAHDTAPTVTADLIGAIDAAAELTAAQDAAAETTSAEQPFGTEEAQAAEAEAAKPPPEEVTELSDGTPLEETSVGDETPPADEGTPAEETPTEETPSEDAPPVDDGGGEVPPGDEGSEAPPAADPDGDESAIPDSDAGSDTEDPVEETPTDDGFEVEELDDETTDTEAEEAEAIAEDIAEEEEAAERKVVNEETTIGELDKDAVAVENFITVLKAGVARKQFSGQTLALAAAKLSELKENFGEYSPKNVPSMETFTNQPNMELAYKAAIESFGGFMARIGGLRKRLKAGILDYWRKGGLVRKIQSRSEAVNKAADVASQKLNDADLKGPVEISSAPSDLSTNHKNLMSAIQLDMKVTSELASKALKANETTLDAMVGIVNDAINKGGAGGKDALEAAIKKIPEARLKYPKGAFNGDLLGGHALKANLREDVGHLMFPSPNKLRAERVKDITLNKADLANCLKLAKVYSGIALAISKTSGVKAAEDMQQLSNQADRVNASAGTMGWNEHSTLDDMVTALPHMLKLHIEVYKFTAGHALDVAEALVSLVNKAV